MPGNPQVENGYVRIANELLEALLRYRLPGEQMQCLLFILRMTYGFQKKNNEISLQQFQDATNIKRPHVSRAIKALKEKRLVTVTQTGNGQVLTYGINKKYNAWKVLPKPVTVTRTGNKVLPELVTDRYQNGQPYLLKKNIKTTIKTRAVLWPKDFCLTEKMKEYAIKKGIDSKKLDLFFEDFKNWAESKGATYKNWEAAFRNRVLKAPEYGKQFISTKEDTGPSWKEKILQRESQQSTDT